MRFALFLIVIGLGGAAILISLGIWQMQRLAWKNGIIADIDARILAAPVALPQTLDPELDAYLPVAVTGATGKTYLRVLVSQKDLGAGYRIITALDAPEGPILLDRGFVSVDHDIPEFPDTSAPQTFVGNLQWPQEIDGFTPEPDLAANIWFARDVPAMAKALGTRPILLVQRELSEGSDGIAPLPVDTTRIANDHLQYAITWFSLAAIWLAMSLYFVRRRTSKSES